MASLDRTNKLGAMLCVLMHDATTWPIHGEYQCRTCGRRFPVPWAGSTVVPAPSPRLAAKPDGTVVGIRTQPI